MTKGTLETVPPVETLVFKNQDDWKAFSDQYFPVTEDRATMFDSIDFTKNVLVYTGDHGAKPQMGATTTIKGYTVQDKMLVPEMDESTNNFAAVVESTLEPEVDVWFMTWDLVKKEDLPRDIENFYQPSLQ